MAPVKKGLPAYVKKGLPACVKKGLPAPIKKCLHAHVKKFLRLMLKNVYGLPLKHVFWLPLKKTYCLRLLNFFTGSSFRLSMELFLGFLPALASCNLVYWLRLRIFFYQLLLLLKRPGSWLNSPTLVSNICALLTLLFALSHFINVSFSLSLSI